jgi:hypothetical protein
MPRRGRLPFRYVLKRDGVRLGGDPGAANRIAPSRAPLALAADQFADDTITGDQLRRVSERLKPRLADERARLAAAQPNPELAGFTGTIVADAWRAADIETRKRVIRLLGMCITINPIGSGQGRTFDPEALQIHWLTPEGMRDAHPAHHGLQHPASISVHETEKAAPARTARGEDTTT